MKILEGIKQKIIELKPILKEKYKNKLGSGLES